HIGFVAEVGLSRAFEDSRLMKLGVPNVEVVWGHDGSGVGDRHSRATGEETLSGTGEVVPVDLALMSSHSFFPERKLDMANNDP
ncbi:hypothetical protein V6N12_049795, partial [Hibiscus sabdariffa]